MLNETNECKMVSETMVIRHPREAIWPLLCPVREYDWIPVWSCRLLYSKSGINELGCVFQTDFSLDGPTDTWVTSVFEPPSRIEFIRTNALRVIRYGIDLHFVDGVTQLLWTQQIVPLGQEGVEMANAKAEAFPAQIAGLAQMMKYYLDTGTMLDHDKE